jgi:hypothetical protein
VSVVNCGGTVRLASASGVLAASRPNGTFYLPNRCRLHLLRAHTRPCPCP